MGSMTYPVADSIVARAPSRWRGGVVALALLVWTFAWDNARTTPGIADAHLTTLLPIPNALRFVEVAVVVVIVGLGLLRARDWSGPQRTGLTLLFCLLLLGAVSTFVAALDGLSTPLIALQTVYSYTSPLLVAGAIGMLPSSRADVSRLMTAFVVLVGISVAVAWYEVTFHGAFADDVHGLMRNAHHFASAVWVVVFLCIARLSAGVGSRVRNLVGILLCAPVAMAAANEKSNIAFALVLFAAGLWIVWRWHWIGRFAVIAGLIVTFLGARAVAAGRVTLPTYFAHVQLVLENMSGVGFLEGYRKMAEVTDRYPRVWIIGTGPASYGSIKAIDQVVLGGEIPPLAERYTAESYRLSYAANGLIGSYVEQSTDLSAFFVEFGAVALVLLLATIWCLLVQPARRALRETDPGFMAIGRWLILSIGFVGVMSVFSAPYGYSALQATTWPLMLIAGLLAGGALDASPTAESMTPEHA